MGATARGDIRCRVQLQNCAHSVPRILPEQLYITLGDFKLESGEIFHDATIAFTVKGQLNAQRTNAIVVCHALSGSAEVEDWSNPKAEFSAMLMPLRNPRIQRRVFDALGLESLYCVIGASMGGMLALEMASQYGSSFVRSSVLIATAARSSAWVIGMGETQRSCIKSDAKWRGGYYGDDPPVDGLAAALMAAMLSYRTHASFEKRFGRDLMDSKALSPANPQVTVHKPRTKESSNDPSVVFLAQSYLWYQGKKFHRRFDANCYLHILDKMDSHDIARGRFLDRSSEEAMKAVLNTVDQPTLIVGIQSDVLYPIQEQRMLAASMPDARFEVLDSEDGHDGFLLEGEQMNKLLRSFLAQGTVGKSSCTVAKTCTAGGIDKGGLRVSARRFVYARTLKDSVKLSRIVWS